MNVPEQLVSELVEQLAEALAPRVAAALIARAEAAGASAGSGWRLLDVEEAAARLGRSTRWVRERAKRGELPRVQLDGGALAFRLEDLEEFARARRVPAEGTATPLAGRLHAVGDRAARAGSARGDRVGNRRVDRA